MMLQKADKVPLLPTGNRLVSFKKISLDTIKPKSFNSGKTKRKSAKVSGFPEPPSFFWVTK